MTSAREHLRHSIPLSRSDPGARESGLVTQVLRSNGLAMGPFTQRFEAPSPR